MTHQDLFSLLRRMESAHPDLPVLGAARRPASEPLRLGQPPVWRFCAPGVVAMTVESGRRRIDQVDFGLLGPQGPLPLWITDWVSEQGRRAEAAPMRRFMDLLSHRLGLLHYRAWAQVQPSVDGRVDRLRVWCDHLTGGVGMNPSSERLHRFAGRLWQPSRDADGLRRWCAWVVGVPVRVHGWSGRWLALPTSQRTRLTGRSSSATGKAGTRPGNRVPGPQDDAGRLGEGAVLGRQIWDVQQGVRVVLGPLDAAQYDRLQPGGAGHGRLSALLGDWLGLRWTWTLQYRLAAADCPRLRLDGGTRLGVNSWLPRPSARGDATDRSVDSPDRHDAAQEVDA